MVLLKACTRVLRVIPLAFVPGFVGNVITKLPSQRSTQRLSHASNDHSVFPTRHQASRRLAHRKTLERLSLKPCH